MLVSFVIPAYNAQDSIDACIASLCACPSSDIEVICVDDGSADRTAALVGEWEARDPRVRLISKTNGGVSSARNVGIEHAHGEYLSFVDADDRLLPDGADAIARACSLGGADVITFGAKACPEEAASPWLLRHIKGRTTQPEPFRADMALGEEASPFVWARAIRRTLVGDGGARFDESLTLGEDLAFVSACMSRADTVMSLATEVYEYQVGRAGSLMSESDRGSGLQLSRHVDVVSSVYDDWGSRDMVRRWDADLANWAIRYVVYAILRDGTEARASQALRMREVWRKHGVPESCASFPKAVRNMVRVVDSFDDEGRCTMSSLSVKRASLAWRLREYGTLDLVETVIGKGGSKSGSGR